MLIITLGLFLNLLMFFVIGLVPTFFLIGSKSRLLKTIALAPVTGFVLTSLVTTYMILLNFPVGSWFIFYAIFWIVMAIGFFLCFFARKGFASIRHALLQRNVIWLLIGISLTTTTVILPMLLGGFKFTALRGNATDSFNYITMARYLDREPYSWKNEVNSQSLIEKDTSYPLAAALLSSRWTTSAVLAFTSHVANSPIYKFEYAYTLLFFIMAFGPAYLIARKLNLSDILSFSVASIICVGFWAQFVLDIRAFSEITSIPVILSIGYLILQIVTEGMFHNFQQPILLGAFCAGLVYSYAEIVPLCILSILFFLIFLLINKKFDPRLFIPIGTVLVLAVLLISPLYSLLNSFLAAQLSSASQRPNNWDVPFFSWLYLHHLIGFWGLVPITFYENIVLIPAVKVILNLILTFLSCILYFITLSTILKVFFRKTSNPSILLIASFCLGALTEFIYLYGKGQLWAAGKALAYGYPFFLLLVVGATFGVGFTFSWPILKKGIKLCVLLWILLQGSLGIARNLVSITDVEYNDYVYNHGRYRVQDYDLSSLENFLTSQPKSIIWTAVSDIWMEEYINFAFNGNHRIIDTLTVTDYYNNIVGYQNLDETPQYLLTERKFLLLNQDWMQSVVAENSDLALLKVDHPDFSFLTVSNSNGIENWNGKAGLWIGKDKVIFNVISSKISEVKFASDFILGPSLPEKEYRNLQISSNNKGVSSSSFVVMKGKNEFTFPVKRGGNLISFEAIDRPSLKELPNGDNRTLLVGMSNPVITFLNIDNKQ